MSSRAWLRGFGVTALLAMGSACGATVVTTDGTCTDGDATYAEGETFPASDGCNTCTCLGDGTISCSQAPCVACEGPMPTCPVPPGSCSASVVCEGGAWACDVTCTGCEGAPPIDCMAPVGCTFTGPICENGTLTCGELVCTPCPDPIPDCGPPPPGCAVDTVCTDAGWECVVSCSSCESQFPAGYALALKLVTASCGCAPDAPCLQVCGMTQACQGEPPTSFCADCVQQQADVQAACAANGVLGPECQGDPECAAYVDCVLSQG